MEIVIPTQRARQNLVKPLVYLVTFFALAPLTLVISFFSLFSLSPKEENLPQVVDKNLIEVPRFGVRVYAALPSEQRALTSSITGADARVEIIKQYLEKYNSPLEPFSNLIVKASDENQLDFRLLTAIAQQESNLCKKVPGGTFNCWGWGIHSRGTLAFSDYPTAIEAVAKGLREEYFDKGYDAPEKIMGKYTPLSSGTWAEGVNQFLQEME